MSNLKIARPYAKAVFAFAKEKGELEKWSSMLNLAQEIAKNQDMAKALKNPTLEKSEVVDLFLDLGKNEFTPEMQNFIQVLGRFNRLVLLPEIADFFESFRQEAEKVTPVEFISAVPVDANYQSRLIAALKRKMPGDILLTCKTDKTLLGGAIIRAGDLIIDGSVRGRLAKLGDTIVY